MRRGFKWLRNRGWQRAVWGPELGLYRAQGLGVITPRMEKLMGKNIEI